MSTAKKIQEYQQLVEQVKPKPRYLRNIVASFAVGGSICLLGQFLTTFFKQQWQLSAENSGALSSICLIVLSALLTGIGVYDYIGQFGGAGSSVPITGFANSVVASGIEFKREGFILGLGAKLFVVAGPVIVYGSLTAFLMGLCRLLLQRIGGS